jgi:aryl-alcohol dehydrogenase-like predicted oxidoreductase
VETRQLGSTDLRITPIGLGAWAIGGAWRFGWGTQEDTDSIAAIHEAIELGLNWIDTAAVYGLGRSEEVVGRALRDVPASRRPYVFTKCSLVWDDQGNVSHNLRPESIRHEIDASLRRLGVDTIDLYQIHWPAWPASPPGSDPGRLEDAWRTLADLQREGKTRHIGLSNCPVSQMERIAPIAPIGSLQPPYSILRRDIEAEILPYCQAQRIGVIVYSPMQSGLLSGAMTRERIAALPADDWRRSGPFFQEPLLSRGLALVEQLRAVGARHGRSSGEVAIAWTLRHPAVTGTLVGARRAGQVKGFIGAATFRLSDSEIEELDAALVESPVDQRR